MATRYSTSVHPPVSASPASASAAFEPRPFGDEGEVEPSSNRALKAQGSRALASIQPKLTIGAPGDPYEQEADRIADQVMAMPVANHSSVQRLQEPEEEELSMKPFGGAIQRLQEPEEEELSMKPLGSSIQRMQGPEEEEELQMKAADSSAQEASSALETSLNQSQGGGVVLDAAARSFIEPRMGFDFSQVRIHTDSQAVQMNAQLGARAFTHGSDIYFGAGQYNPASDDGRRLLSHELTHVVQQSGGGLGNHIAREAETQQDAAREQLDAAQTAYRAGEYDIALGRFRATYALISGRHRADIAYNMAVCHQALGQFDAAIDMYQEYLSVAGISRRDRALALEQIRRARTGDRTIATEPPTSTAAEQAESTRSARQLFEEGQAAFAASNYQLALERFTEIYADPYFQGRELIVFNMAVCHEQLNEYDAAISLYREYAQFSGATDAQRQEALDRIRTCRHGESGDDAPEPLSHEEQAEIFHAAQAAFSNGQYAAALADFQRIYHTPVAQAEVRRIMLYNMGICHQRLQAFDQAIDLWQEYLLSPGLSDGDRQEALNAIRQARQSEVGTNTRMGGPDEVSDSGHERVLVSSVVYFPTGSSRLGPEGSSSLQTLHRILLENHALHPGASFRIAVVGQASQRWRHPGSQTAADLNTQLSADRADAVANSLTSQLPADQVRSGIFTVDRLALGSDTPGAAIASADDNSWMDRCAFVTVWLRE